jgi:hypothetical protein
LGADNTKAPHAAGDQQTAKPPGAASAFGVPRDLLRHCEEHAERNEVKSKRVTKQSQ